MCFCRSTLPGALVHNFTRMQAMTAGANNGPLVAGAPCPGLDANGAPCSGVIAPIPTRCRLLHEMLAWKLAERSLSDDVYNELLVDAEALLRHVAIKLGFESLKAFMTSARSNALSGAASVAIFRKMLAELADETARERERIVDNPLLRLFAATPPLELAGLDKLGANELPSFSVANYPKFDQDKVDADSWAISSFLERNEAGSVPCAVGNLFSAFAVEGPKSAEPKCAEALAHARRNAGIIGAAAGAGAFGHVAVMGAMPKLLVSAELQRASSASASRASYR